MYTHNWWEHTLIHSHAQLTKLNATDTVVDIFKVNTAVRTYRTPTLAASIHKTINLLIKKINKHHIEMSSKLSLLWNALKSP